MPGRWRGAAALIFSLLAGGCNAQIADLKPETPADIVIVAKMTTADQLERTGSYELVVDQLEPITHDPLYPKLSEKYRHLLDSLLGYSAFRLREIALAHQAYVRATGSPLADPDDWYWRLETAKLDTDFADAFSSFRSLRDRTPGFEGHMVDRTVSVLDQGFGTLRNSEAQFEWEDYLQSRGWRPLAPDFSPDVIRLHYALHLLEHGERDKAEAVVRTFGLAPVIAAEAADRRFDKLSGGDWTPLDAKAASQARLAMFRQESQADPRSLLLQSAVASQLYELGRSDEALAVIDRALAAAQQMSVAEQRATPDFSQALSHALIQKSYFLFSLGRYEEALGVAAAEGGCRVCGANTDTAMLQAQWLIALGRGREALEQLQPVSNADMTLPGRSALAEKKACAAVEAGDDDARRAALGYLQAHLADAPQSLLRAQLCADDLEGAAATLKTALDDPGLRILALGEIQDFLPDGKLTSQQLELAARLAAIRRRPDIQAAVAKVGRILHQDIRKDELY